MEEKILREVLQQAPFGYAYYKLVYNAEGLLKDYIFLDVNPAFEEMTGLKRENILGKKVTEVLQDTKNSGFDWVDFYGKAVLGGERREFTQYAKPLGRWYKITSFSPHKDHFVTIFQEVTLEMERIKTLEEQERRIRELTNELETVFNGTQDAMFLVRVKNGKVKYLVGSRKDITLQKKAEKERKELLNRLQTMFNGHTAVMLLFEPISGRIVYANPAACTFYGYSMEELLNMHIQDINMLPKEEVAKHWLMALQEKQRYFIFPHRLKNGEVRLVDVYSCPITYNGENLLFSIIFDVTDREKYKKELYIEKELFRTTLLSIGDGVVTTDLAGNITVMNQVAQEITGYSEEEVKGRPFAQVFQLISEGTGKKVEDPVAKVLETGKTIGLENNTVLIAKDGRQIPIAHSAAPIKDEQAQTFGVVMVFRDVTKEKAWEKEILDLSYQDSLTSLYNRRFMEEQIKRLEKSRELPISVIMADVNGLKLANDVFGHEEGDKLLIKAAEVLKESCRKEDIIARWGGDEFLILLPRTSAKTAEEIIERIKNGSLHVKSGKTKLSIALGYAVRRKDSGSLVNVVEEAEEAMYKRKLLESKSYRNALINTLLTTLYIKSSETEEHGERLKNYCLKMGREMRLSAKEMDELALFAMLHDIGKVGIKESVLQKPGALTAEEWEEIKKHPEIGWRIAQNTQELVVIAEYILCHHERWDGKGYPRGLKGEEIPLLCRILAVTDAYDAMTNSRSYRKALSKEEAIAEIKRNAGTQFDPEVVNVFLNIITNYKSREVHEN